MDELISNVRIIKAIENMLELSTSISQSGHLIEHNLASFVLPMLVIIVLSGLDRIVSSIGPIYSVDNVVPIIPRCGTSFDR